VVGEDLERGAIVRDDLATVLPHDLAQPIHRQESDLAVWQLLDHHLCSNRKPGSVEFPRKRNHVAVANPAHAI